MLLIILSLLGVACWCLTIGFILGVAWGVNFAKATEAKNKAAKEPDTLLVPRVVTDEQIANILAATAAKNSIPETPRPYRVPAIPGLD